MELSREEYIWIRKNTRKEDKKKVSDFLKKKQIPKKSKRKIKKNSKVIVTESHPSIGSKLDKWIKSTRGKLIKKKTKSESEFYEVLSILGIPFEIQYPFVLNNRVFFADAYFEKTKTIIEIDGGYHSLDKVRKRDQDRSYLFIKAGYTVIRIQNEDVSDRSYFLSKLMKHIPIKLDAYKILG